MSESESDWTSSARVPTFENTEVDADLRFTWEITDWDVLEDRQVSPTFECGGYLWEILLFPRGNPPRGCISLYLNALGPKQETKEGDSSAVPQTNWHVCAAFSLAMWNPNHPNVFVTQSSNHRFTPRVSDWGYNEFTVLRSVFTRGQNAPAPLITHRAPEKQLGVNISVQLNVLSDPTGVLWHDFHDYDSRDVTGYTGLVNQGATCYLNSLLQSLFFTRAFRNAVYEIPDSSGVSGGLQRLFYKLATSHPAVDTTDLTRAFGWDSADAFTQHDVQELARVLMDRLESKMKNTTVDGFLSKLFVGQMKSYIKCINVPFESSRTEDFWDVQLNVRGMPDVYASFKDYCAAETLEGDNQYAAGEFGLQDAVKGVLFESLPPVLHLQLKRYDYDWMRDVEVKINDHYEFPLELDLSEFVENDGKWQYDLHGVLVHAGDLNAGHYYALIKPESNGGWYKFDDDRVTKATLREVLDENFGSNEGSLLRRVTSAYMLVYIRRDSSNFVLPTGNADLKPPAEIAERIEAEKQAEELRQQALVEQQQYMTLRVLTPKNYLHHEGPGILPWSTVPLDSINEYEEPSNLKIRIATKLSTLARQLEAGSLWLCPTPHSTYTNARARSQKMHAIPITDGYSVEQLAEWVTHPSPVIFVGPASPGQAKDEERFVFLKTFDGKELKGSDARWISNQVSLRKALGLTDRHSVYLEASSPTRRKHEATVVALDIGKTGLDLAIEPSDILIVAENAKDNQVAEYFDQLANKVTLVLIPFYEDEEADTNDSSSEESGLESGSEISVPVSMRDSYETVLGKIASAVNYAPEKLQLRSYPAQWQRSTLITSSGENISDLWTHTSTDTVRVLYRRLPVPLSEFEQMREVTLSWLPDGHMNQERQRTILGKPADLLTLSIEQPIVVWIAQHGRRVKEMSDPTLDYLANCQAQSLEIYAAPLIESEQKARAVEGAKLCSCFHYTKDPSRTHGIPFQFALVPGEEFKTTKLRLYRLLRHNGDSDRSLEKIQFSVVRDRSFDQIYITDESLILYDVLGPSESVGLDHPDRRRAAYQQQAIHID